MKFKFVLIAAIILTSYTAKTLWWDPASKKEDIQNTFLSKNYSLFIKEVSQNDSLFTPGETNLLLAYGYNALGDYQKANVELNHGFNQQGNTPELNFEIVLNLLLNAYLQNDVSAFGKYINLLNSENPLAYEWKKLFQGVAALRAEKCSQALKIFSSPLNLETLNPIMTQLFSEKLPPTWTSFQIAQCEMTMGNYDKARELIQKTPTHKSLYEAEMAHMLIGKSYFLEASDKNDQESLPYYSLAIHEIERSPKKSGEFNEITEQLISSLQSRLQQGLERGDINHISFFDNALNMYQKEDYTAISDNDDSPNHAEETSEPPHQEPVAIADPAPVMTTIQTPVILEPVKLDFPTPAATSTPKQGSKFSSRSGGLNNLDEWAYENPLDLNYALVQRRIDSILDGERDVATSEKQLKEDAEFLTMLTQITPPLPPVYFLLGQVELLLHDYPKASRALGSFVTFEPDNIWGWRLLALSQMGANNYTAAIKTFGEVIKINPVDLAAWKSLGKIYESEGNRDLAINAYERARIMSPSDPEIISSLDRLYNKQR